ncbi:hypothetical protein SIO70_00650 [Chitinophaga sancti]|uniref:hypothetical protein n=1 Tax=Chitinophaga sancti TaxID=1004 RepID=UPI002A755D82|nr:hypothetical protein [Chitinophaga sancti]WPQ63370.1 hypothetical protein SIO70_00650 [Chitinophaga sancti]
MDLQTAINLQKAITNQFLFSRQRQYAIAGDEDDFHSADGLIYDIFNDIFGVSVAGSDQKGYYVELFSEQKDLYLNPIRDYYRAGPNDIRPFVTSPFELRYKKRPLEIGCSVSHRLNNIKGTLGGLVKGLEDGQTYILSNHHVLYNSQDVDDNFVIQPCTLDGGEAGDTIGLYCKSLAYSLSEVNEHDAAIAGPISVDVNWIIPGIAAPVEGLTIAKDGNKVYKIGAMSGKTYGTIASSLISVKVNIDGQQYDFANQILIK